MGRSLLPVALPCLALKTAARRSHPSINIAEYLLFLLFLVFVFAFVFVAQPNTTFTRPIAKQNIPQLLLPLSGPR